MSDPVFWADAVPSNVLVTGTPVKVTADVGDGVGCSVVEFVLEELASVKVPVVVEAAPNAGVAVHVGSAELAPCSVVPGPHDKAPKAEVPSPRGLAQLWFPRTLPGKGAAPAFVLFESWAPRTPIPRPYHATRRTFSSAL